MTNGEDLLSRDEILGMDDIQMEEVVVPEWKHIKGGKVLISGMTQAGKDAYTASLMEIRGNSRKLRLENATAKLLVRCIVNRQRQPIFTEADIEKLGTKSAVALERLLKVAQRLSAMTQEDVEALVKNSDAAQSDASPTVSL